MNNMRPAMGRVLLDLPGTTLEQSDIHRIRHPECAGLILFSRNFQDTAQLSSLIRSVRDLRPELLIAVDHEGGRVQRFRQGFTRLPAAACYASATLEDIEHAGWLMAAELRAVGVDFSFAPVLDVDSGISAIIGDRAFATEPEQVSTRALAWMRGMHRAGMAATGKHFPGHGGVALDSHESLPVDDRSLEALRRRDLRPFADLIAAGMEAVMPAHVVYPAVDRQPAGYSARWLQQELVATMGFRGAIFSDDLGMAGAAGAGSYPERASAALKAGCHVLLVCNQPAAADAVLAWLETQPPAAPEQGERLQSMRGRGTPLTLTQLASDPLWQQTHDWLEQLAHGKGGAGTGAIVGEKAPETP
ncbi:MAG: hypothetical protein RIQ52_1562 [Pseudomonadota bacterium]